MEEDKIGIHFCYNESLDEISIGNLNGMWMDSNQRFFAMDVGIVHRTSYKK